MRSKSLLHYSGFPLCHFRPTRPQLQAQSESINHSPQDTVQTHNKWDLVGGNVWRPIPWRSGVEAIIPVVWRVFVVGATSPAGWRDTGVWCHSSPPCLLSGSHTATPDQSPHRDDKSGSRQDQLGCEKKIQSGCQYSLRELPGQASSQGAVLKKWLSESTCQSQPSQGLEVITISKWLLSYAVVQRFIKKGGRGNKVQHSHIHHRFIKTRKHTAAICFI